MDAGLSVGGIASIGLAAGGGINAASAIAGQSQPAAATGGTSSPAATDFVVTISDAAVKALTLDAATAISSGASSRLADDLAALALLAILEKDQQQKNALVAAAAAINAYLAIQVLTG